MVPVVSHLLAKGRVLQSHRSDKISSSFSIIPHLEKIQSELF